MSQPGSAGATRGDSAGRRAAGGQRLAGAGAGRSRRVPAPQPRRDAARLHAAAARHAAGAAGLARRPRRAAARCTSCSPPSACSRCWSAPRSGCAVRAIRRRCTSSGCASRSSACSPSPSTVRSIGSTGSSTGVTRSRSRCCRRCCCISRWCSRSGRPRRSGPGFRSALVPLMYVPALALGAARVVAVARASQGSLSGPLFSRALELLDRSEPVYLFVCAVAALAVLVRGVPADHVGDRRAGSCGGSRGAPRSASGRSRSATRCRGRSASIRRWRCS